MKAITVEVELLARALKLRRQVRGELIRGLEYMHAPFDMCI